MSILTLYCSALQQFERMLPLVVRFEKDVMHALAFDFNLPSLQHMIVHVTQGLKLQGKQCSLTITCKLFAALFSVYVPSLYHVSIYK
jgi:hypothetical protein